MKAFGRRISGVSAAGFGIELRPRRATPHQPRNHQRTWKPFGKNQRMGPELEDELEGEEWVILAVLAAVDPMAQRPNEIGAELTDLTKLTPLRIRHHLDRLRKFGLVERRRTTLAGGKDAYGLSPQGRAFAVEHNLDDG